LKTKSLIIEQRVLKRCE